MVAPHCAFFASNALAESPTTIWAPTILVWQQPIRFFTTTFVTVAWLMALALEKPWPIGHVELVMFVQLQAPVSYLPEPQAQQSAHCRLFVPLHLPVTQVVVQDLHVLVVASA
jgi:hypothetical protein